MSSELSFTDLGERLQKRRSQIGLSQEALAEKMDVSIQTISDMENGKTKVKTENLFKACKILNLSVDYVLTGKAFGTNPDMELIKKIDKLSDRDRGAVEALVDYLINR